MSHHQSTGNRDSQHRRSSRSGGGSSHQRPSTVKSGGGGGHGPSPSAPLLSPAVQPSPIPRSGDNDVSKRSGATNGQSRVNSSINHEAEVQKASQGSFQHQGQPHGHGARSSMQPSNGSAPRSSRPLTSSNPSHGPTESVPSVPKPETSWSTVHPQLSFQFGSIGPTTFMPTGVQIPARTSSAPPNLDEQKQDQARYEGIHAAVPKSSVPSTGQQHQQQQQTRSQFQQSGGQQTVRSQSQQQPAAVLSTGIPQAPYIKNQTHQHPGQAQMAQANTHIQLQAAVNASPHLPMPAHLVASQTQHQLAFPQMQFQPTVPSLSNQLLGPHLAPLPPQQMSQMPHQLSGALPTTVASGMPPATYTVVPVPNHIFQPRTNRAVKIVHPETHEELKFDSRSSKTESGTEISNSASSASFSGRMTGNGSHARPSLTYNSNPNQGNQAIYTTQQNGPYAIGSQHYHVPSSGVGSINRNVNENLYGHVAPSPSVGSTRNMNAENAVVSTSVQSPQRTVMHEVKNPTSVKIEKSTVTSISEESGKSAESPGYTDSEKSSNKKKLESFNLPAIEDKQMHEQSKGQSDQVHEQVKGQPVSSYKDGQRTAAKDPAIVEEQAKCVQGDPASKDGKNDSIPEGKQGIKKKKKKEEAQKVSKIQVETKKHGGSNMAYNVKNVMPKSEGQAEAAKHNAKSETPKYEGHSADDQAVTPTLKEKVSSEEALKSADRDVTQFASSSQYVVEEDTIENTVQQTETETLETKVLETSKNEDVIDRTGALEVRTSELNLQSTQENINVIEELTQSENLDKTIEDIHNIDVVHSSNISLASDSIDETETDARPISMSAIESKTEIVEAIHEKSSFNDIPVAAADIKASNIDASVVSLHYHRNTEDVDASKPLEITTTETEQTTDIVNNTSSVTLTKDDATAEAAHIVAPPEIKSGNKKKKMKDILAKADAAGSTADLYNAYKAPEENKSEKTVSKVGSSKLLSTETVKQTVIPEETAAPKEVDDWEDAVELPNPRISAGIEAGNTNKSGGIADINVKGCETYTRDFLLTFKDQNTELPSDFEVKHEIADLLVNPQLAFQQSSARMLDRQLSGGSRRGTLEEDRWPRQHGLQSPPWPDNYMDAVPPSGFRPGGAPGLIPRLVPNIRPGVSIPPITPGLISGKLSTVSPIPGVRTGSVDSDRWQRLPPAQKGLIPSPLTPLPPVHKAERRYEVGKASDEEELKQRQIKGILNKLTPQNFDKLFAKVKDVNIQSAVTLNGVISQIFDKALTEPTFCEMYAKFCKQLATEMPEFIEDDEKVTFKRVLLNKCQEEFQRGEREQDEASRIESDGKEMAPEEREEKRIRAKRRMLGNIRFIGELYKKHMLTERIMHECIRKLLGEFENPEEEDVEALCKLVSTIGHMIDQDKAKEHIDAYFDRMDSMSSNMKLSARIRFMLKDVIDLRRNNWHERRKVEGPKKIDEVHRDAVQERQATVAQAGRLSRGPSMGTSSGRRIVTSADIGVRGLTSPMISPTTPISSFKGTQPQIGGRGLSVQDVRMEDRLLIDNRLTPMPLSQRSVDETPITLVPQGGLSRGIRSVSDVRRFGPSSLSAYSSSSTERPLTPPEKPILDRPDRHAGPSIKGSRNLERTMSDRAVSNSSVSLASQHQQQSNRPSTAPALVPFDEEQLKEQSKAALIEYFSARDMREIIRCIEDLKAPSFYSTMVYVWTCVALEKKELQRELFVKLLIDLCKSEPSIIKHDQVFLGFQMAVENLEDFAMDVPKAPQYLIEIFNKLYLEGVLSTQRVSELKKGSEFLKELQVSGQEINRGTSVNMNHIEKQILQYLSGNEPVSEMQKWLEQNITSQILSDSGFSRVLMSQILKHSVPATYKKEQDKEVLEEKLSQYVILLKRFASDQDKQRQYIVAMQSFVHNVSHPPGLMTALCSTFYENEVISESAYVNWGDDVKDITLERELALRDAITFLSSLKTPPYQR